VVWCGGGTIYRIVRRESLTGEKKYQFRTRASDLYECPRLDEWWSSTTHHFIR